jgi:hypothetical protein
MTMVKMIVVAIRMEVVFNVSRFTSCFTNVIMIIMKNPVLHNVLYVELLQWVAQQW